MVLSEVFALAASGMAIGLAVAWAPSRFLESFLFGVKRNDSLSVADRADVSSTATVDD